MNDDPLDRMFYRKAMGLGLVGVPLAYVLLFVLCPDYWAVLTGVVFVLGSGLFTSKVLLSLENPWLEFGLAPVFGAGWLVFLWLLFKLAG